MKKKKKGFVSVVATQKLKLKLVWQLSHHDLGTCNYHLLTCHLATGHVCPKSIAMNPHICLRSTATIYVTIPKQTKQKKSKNRERGGNYHKIAT